MKCFLSLFISLLLCTIVFAQKDPIKWGKVAKADLNMTVYDNDPDAEAVVLMDLGTINFDISSGDFKYVLDRHVRIKLLKKSAFDRGDISIPFYHYKHSEEVTSIKAQVISPNGDKQKVGRKDIFEVKTNDYWSKMNFAFPALEEGCIIEYKYSIKSDLIYYLTDWYFQSDIPVRHSEFRTNIPEWFDYVSFKQGALPKEESGEVQMLLKLPRQSIGPARSAAGGQVNARVIKKRYYMQDVPALKPERFITTMKDYYAKVSLQLQSVKFPNSHYQDMTTSWTTLADEMEKSPVFGDQINKKRHAKQIVSAVEPYLKDLTSDSEKVMAAYRFLSNNVKWNELYGFTSNSLDKAFEDKLATSGELNLMLIAICRHLGIEAYPVLVSTRSHGKMFQHYPKTDQFNHVLTFVQIDDQQMLLDVGSPSRSPDLIRAEALNYIGWLVDQNNPQWIEIPGSTDMEVTMAKLVLSEDGTLSGTVDQSFKGYCAMRERADFHKYKKENLRHVKEDWAANFPDVQLNDIQFENEDQVSKSLKCKLEVEIPDAVQINHPFIYVSPMLGQGLAENPLKLVERAFPVDIPYQQRNQFVLNLTIPEGYTVEEFPEPIKLKTEGGGASFQYRLSQNGNIVQLISKIQLKKLHYEPKEYAIIKNFFDTVIEKQGEQIVLKKVNP